MSKVCTLWIPKIFLTLKNAILSWFFQKPKWNEHFFLKGNKPQEILNYWTMKNPGILSQVLICQLFIQQSLDFSMAKTKKIYEVYLGYQWQIKCWIFSSLCVAAVDSAWIYWSVLTYLIHLACTSVHLLVESWWMLMNCNLNVWHFWINHTSAHKSK